MSTSSRSKHRSALRLERRHRVVGGVAGLAVALTIIWISAARSNPAEIRIAETGDTLTVQVVDGRHTILFANASGPTIARAALGTLNRPWEPQPSVIITDSRDNVARGLWETLQRAPARQLIVLGAPGDSEDWVRIERHCRDEGIEVRYLEHATALPLDSLTLTLVPGASTSRGFPDTHAVISNGKLRVAVSLGGLPASGRFHALATNDTLPAPLSADLLIYSEGNGEPGRSESAHRLRVEPGRRVVLVLEPSSIRVRGGVLDSGSGG